MKKIFASAAVCCLPLLGQNDDPAQTDADQSPIVYKNIALWNTNAQMISVENKKIGDPLSPNGILPDGLSSLINGDVGKTLTFKKGNHSVIIDLSTDYAINRINFAVLSGKGQVRAYTAMQLRSPSSKRWIAIGQAIDFENNKIISFDSGGVFARYVMLDFSVEQVISFSSPGVFSDISASDWMIDVAELDSDSSDSPKSNPSADSETSAGKIPIDFASLSSGASVSYATNILPADTSAMIDDDVETYVEFNEGGENGFSAAIVDLSTKRNLDRVSFLVDGEEGTLQLFTLSNLEELRTEVPSVALLQKDFLFISEGEDDLPTGALPQQIIADYISDRTPAVTISLSGGLQSIERIASLAARYVLVVFIPENPSSSNFKIFETSFLSEVESEDIIVTQVVATAEDGSPVNALVFFSPTAFNPDAASPPTIAEVIITEEASPEEDTPEISSPTPTAPTTP